MAKHNFEIAARTLCLRACGAMPRFTAAVKIPLPRQHFSSRLLLNGGMCRIADPDSAQKGMPAAAARTAFRELSVGVTDCHMIKFLKNKQIRNVCVVNTIVSYPFSLKLGVCSQCESLLLSAVLYRELQSLILSYHSDSLNYVKVRSGLVCGSLQLRCQFQGRADTGSSDEAQVDETLPTCTL